MTALKLTRFNFLFMFLLLVLLGLANISVTFAQTSSDIVWLHRLPYDTDAGAVTVTQTGGLYLSAYTSAGLTGYGNGHGDNRGAIDFSRAGTSFQVRAARAGRVTVLPGCGVIINHGDETEALYYHLTNIQVSNGQYVFAGHHLGNAGANCGSATGIHLHLEVRPTSNSNQEFPIRFATLGPRPSQNSSNVCPAYLVCPRNAAAGNEFYYPYDVPAQNRTSWSFGSGPLLWFGTNDLGNMKLLDGGLWFRILDTDGSGHIDSTITGPVIQPVPASEYPEVRVTIGRQADSCMELFWIREGDAGFSGDRRIQLTGLPTSSSGTHVFETGEHPNWNGNITRLRLDPTCGGAGSAGGAIRLDAIRFASSTTTVSAFEITSEPETLQLGIGGTGNIIFVAENPQLAPGGGIRALDIECDVTSNIVTGVTVNSNSLFSSQAIEALLDTPAFPPGPSFQWLASERDGQPSVSATGTILTVTYTGATEGTAPLSCNIDAIDGNGDLIASVPYNVPTTIVVLGNGSVSGIVTLDSADDHSGITVSLYDLLGNVVATATTAADGSFSLPDVAPGTYQLEADAPGYVSTRTGDTTVSGSDFALPNGSLIAGDINDDEAVDLLDITQFAADYPAQQTTPTADYDVTRDGSVNLSDFFITVQNLDTTGPTPWE